MPRAYAAAAMASTMVSNPYATPKDVLPTTTICEVCDNREIMTKDWHGHKNSKGHRKNEEAAKAKENQSPGDANGDSSDGWQNTADVTGDVATTGWGDNGSFGSTNASGNGNHGRSGNANGNRKFNGACYGCGEEGHSKRDCPQASARACYGCGQTGHNKADCPNGRHGGGGGGGGRECYNCGEVGHNKRDCPQAGGGGGGDRACFNCGEIGHNKVDCPNPRQNGGGGGGGGRACFNCGQTGHSKSDCTNERVMICRNCDGIGHMSKECPQPRDWSRVKCNNCGQMGHTVKRCNQPIQEHENGFGAGGGGGGGWDEPAAQTSGDWANDDGATAVDHSVATGGWADAEGEKSGAGGGGWGDDSTDAGAW